MRKLSLLSVLILTVLSCTNKSAGTSTDNGVSISSQGNMEQASEVSATIIDGWKFDTLTVDKKIHMDNDTTKDGMKIHLSFVYPVSAPEGVDLGKIQQTFAGIFSESKDFSGSPQDAFDGIVDNYTSEAVEIAKELQKEGNEFINFSNFEQQKETFVTATSMYQISLSSVYYSYMGGAHGMHNLKCDNVDLRDGSVITEDRLFARGYKDKLAALIQNVVKERNSSADEDTHILLLVDIPEIMPNNNFAFEGDGLVYYYNQYEISPYVQGVVEIKIPYDKVKPLINKQYIEVIDAIR